MATLPMTAEELRYLSLPDKRTELVRGRLIVREPAGSRHGAVANLLAYRLTAHVETTRVTGARSWRRSSTPGPRGTGPS